MIARIIPFLICLYALLSVLLLVAHERTRLFPLYVLKVAWTGFTILAFAWVLIMSGGKSAEYIQHPTGPMTIVVGEMVPGPHGQQVLSGGYRGALAKYTGTTPYWVLALLFMCWVTWGLVRRQWVRRGEPLAPSYGFPVTGAEAPYVAEAEAVSVSDEAQAPPVPWPMLVKDAAVFLVLLLFVGGWRDGLAFAVGFAAWLVMAVRAPNFFGRWGHWLLAGLLAVLLLPLIEPIRHFGWGRYRFFGENYRYAWNEAHIGQYFMNSMIVTITTVALTTLSGAMAAYAIARRRFVGRGVLYAAIIGSIAIPGILIQVPLFLLIKEWTFNVGAYRYSFMDSRLGLAIIYAAISLPFTIFVLVGFFRTLPGELGESAYIDGAGQWRTFTEIYLPLAMPGIATTGIFNFLGAWNEFNLGMIFMSNPNFKTLPIGLYELQSATQYSAAWAPMFAGIVLLCLPTFLIFIFLQERIVAGLTAGGLKG